MIKNRTIPYSMRWCSTRILASSFLGLRRSQREKRASNSKFTLSSACDEGWPCTIGNEGKVYWSYILSCCVVKWEDSGCHESKFLITLVRIRERLFCMSMSSLSALELAQLFRSEQSQDTILARCIAFHGRSFGLFFQIRDKLEKVSKIRCVSFLTIRILGGWTKLTFMGWAEVLDCRTRLLINCALFWLERLILVRNASGKVDGGGKVRAKSIPLSRAGEPAEKSGIQTAG